MREILIVIAVYNLGIGIFALYAYFAIYKPIKDTLKRYRKIDDEPIPNGIEAREI